MSVRADQYDRRRGLRRLVQLDGVAKQALDTGHIRLIAIAAGFALCFLVIAGRLVGLAALAPTPDSAALPAEVRQPHIARAEIFDRNGVLLASNVRGVSIFANPRKVLDAAQAAAALGSALPDLNPEKVSGLLASDR